jgi:hypothetical protein
MSATKFASSANRIQARFGESLSTDELEHSIPSAFAKQAHASRSEKYVYVPTGDIIQSMVKENFLPVFACQSKARSIEKREFTKHMIRFRKGGADLSQSEIPEIVLVNSHDGSSSYMLTAGIFRMVCTNGLITGDKYESVHVQHSGNILDSVLNGAHTVARDFDRALGTVQKFKEITLTPNEQGIFAEAAATVRFRLEEGQKSPVEPTKLLEARRSEDNKPDLWTTLNRIQENVIQGGQRGKSESGRRMRTREVKGISDSILINRALWSLAEKMSELKAAGN